MAETWPVLSTARATDGFSIQLRGVDAELGSARHPEMRRPVSLPDDHRQHGDQCKRAAIDSAKVCRTHCGATDIIATRVALVCKTRLIAWLGFRGGGLRQATWADASQLADAVGSASGANHIAEILGYVVEVWRLPSSIANNSARSAGSTTTAPADARSGPAKPQSCAPPRRRIRRNRIPKG